MLAQADLAATTLTDIYVTPAGKFTNVTEILICNRAGAGSFRVSLAKGGVADSVEQYLYFDTPIAANETIVLKTSFKMDPTDELRAYSSTGDMTFVVNGVEV